VVAPVASLLGFQPAPPFRALMAEESGLVCVRAANGAGKTQHIAALVAKRALRHPGSFHRVVGPSRSQVREVLGRYLWALLRPYLHPSSRWLPGTGWTRNGVVVLANGSEIELKSYQDDPDTQEGRHDLMTIVLDEVPPKAHFEANRGRAQLFVVAFTVQTKASPLWLRHEVEGSDDSPTRTGRTRHSTGWIQYLVQFRRENVPFYTHEEFETRRSRHAGTEAEQRRLDAAWESESAERVFTGFSSRLIRTREQILEMLRDGDGRLRFTVARYGIDYGTKIGKQCQYLILVKGDRYFVVDEWIGGGTTTPIDYARGLQAAVDGWLGKGTTGLYRLNRVYGDVNSAGPAAAGDSLNILLERALCSVYGLEALPWPVRAPAKVSGWKDARETAMNHAMIEGRWFVINTAEHAIRAYRQYEGGDTDQCKDPIDGQGYAIQDLLLQPMHGPVVQLARS
jgi:hypothetical protein